MMGGMMNGGMMGGGVIGMMFMPPFWGFVIALLVTLVVSIARGGRR